jgi:uncharacterized membrane protein
MTDLELGPVVFGLLSAVTWGAGDFSGGLASKRAGVFSVIIASQLIGMFLLIGLALAFDTAVPESSDLVWGAGAGLAGAVGLFALYRGLAAGRMGLVAPLSAVLAATLPVVVGAITQGLPDGVQCVGFGPALTGVWLLSRPPRQIRQIGFSSERDRAVGGGGAGLLSLLRADGLAWPLHGWPLS